MNASRTANGSASWLASATSSRPSGSLRLLGDGTEPFAIFIDEPPKLSLRQFKLDQRKSRFGPSAEFNQLIDPGLHTGTEGWYSRTCLRDQGRHRFGRDRVGTTKSSLKLLRESSAFRIKHDASLMPVG